MQQIVALRFVERYDEQFKRNVKILQQQIRSFTLSHCSDSNCDAHIFIDTWEDVPLIELNHEPDPIEAGV